MGSRYSTRNTSDGPGQVRSNQSTAEANFVGADLERCKQAHHQPTQMENAQRNLQELQSNLLIELEILVGSRRAEKLYRNHVCRKHFLMVYGEGEKEKRLVDKLKRCLRNEGEEVEGPWSIFYGQDITNGWQRLSNNAKAVVVLMSPTLFQDNRLCRYLSEMWHSHQDTIMPLFLEPLTPHNLPSSLAFLRQTNGRKVSENDWNPHSFITSLLQQCSRLRCFCMEISSLEALRERELQSGESALKCVHEMEGEGEHMERYGDNFLKGRKWRYKSVWWATE